MSAPPPAPPAAPVSVAEAQPKSIRQIAVMELIRLREKFFIVTNLRGNGLTA
jgi:hypothetical protein